MSETKIELRVLEIDVKKTIQKLENLWAIKVWEKNMKRYIYDFSPKKDNNWIRLRTDGIRTTLTIKKIEKETIDGTKELEIVVDNFEKTHLFLEKLGYCHKRYQENNRISYELDDVQIEIDFWPLIPPYMEIEGNSEEDVKICCINLVFP
jgi:adenylate cyclase, class 2